MMTSRNLLDLETSQLKGIHFIDSLTVNMTLGNDVVKAEVHDATEPATKLLDALGVSSEVLMLSGRNDVALSVRFEKPASNPQLAVNKVAGTAVPLPRLVELHPRPLDYNTTQPIGMIFAAEAKSVILGPGLSRYQRMILCGGARRAIQVLEEVSIEFAGAGNWQEVFSLSKLVVLSAKDARSVTAATTTDEAITTLTRMAPKSIFLVLDQAAVHCTAGDRQIAIPAPVKREHLVACAAVAVVAMDNGLDLEAMVLAVVGCNEAEQVSEAVKSIEQFVELGEYARSREELMTAVAVESQKMVKTVATAAIAAGLLIGFVVPWVVG